MTLACIREPLPKRFPAHQRRGSRKYNAHKMKAFVVNSFDFGLAQSRERVFITGVWQNAFGKKRRNALMDHWQTKVKSGEDFTARMMLVLFSQFYAFPFCFKHLRKKNIAWAKRKLFQVGFQRTGDDEAVVEAGAGKKFRQLEINRRSFFLLQQGRCLGSIWHTLARIQ